MATKEQERKTLTEIEKMVLGLGVGSYIATAFEGCWEIAQDNIENDYGNSMKKQRDMTCDQLESAMNTIKSMKEELDRRNEAIKTLRKSVANLSESDKDHLIKQSNAEKIASEHIQKLADYEVKCAQQEDEILHLKARLYDFMTGKEF